MSSSGLGEFIKERRAQLGLSQTAVADAAGLPKSHLSSIEAGKIAFPNADIRRRLAQALGVSHLDLLVAAGEIMPEELQTAGKTGVVQRGPHTIADQIVECARAVNWETFPALADSILRTLSGIVEDQKALRRR